MDLPGPLSISSLRPASNTDLGLRPFQKVTAQVLGVAGINAVLAIEGHPIVARLSSPDQAAILLSQRTAQFIVTKLSSQEITLKFLRHENRQAVPANSNQSQPELAVHVLSQYGIPINTNHLTLARSVLNQSLPVTPGLLKELLGALSASGAWGPAQAELATALKAAGLPVTAASLALAARQAAQTGEALGQLISQLQTAGQNLPPDLLKEIRRSLKMLEGLALNAEGDTAMLAVQIRKSVNLLGRSLENALLEQAQNPEASVAENNLLSLARLEQALRQAGETELAGSVETFLRNLSRRHFLQAKAESEPMPGRDMWSEIGFRLGGERGASARLRVKRDPHSVPGSPETAPTRFVLQVDISEAETVEVDLSLAGKHIRTQVTATDRLWCQLAENELPSLEQALQKLGYTLQETQFSIGEPLPFEELKITSSSAPLMTVNIEV